MVDGQIVASFAAILAGVVVSMQNVAPGEADLFIRDFDVIAQSDDGWKSKAAVEDFTVVFDALCLPFEDENDGASPAAYVQRLV